MSRIGSAFARMNREGRKGFIPFITAGDPDLATTRDLLVELSVSGATLIELGVPFTDPVADGPVIQRASQRALRHNFGIEAVLDTLAKARPDMAGVPVILFSYFNPLLQFGIERLSKTAMSSTVDGVLVTDLPPEEAGYVGQTLRSANLDTIFLVAPTSSDQRLELISENSAGFIYAVSRAGITGAPAESSATAKTLVNRVRRFTNLPVAVGFGISTTAQISETWQYADAAVVGSAIVAKIEALNGDPQLVAKIGNFCRDLLPGTSDSNASFFSSASADVASNI